MKKNYFVIGLFIFQSLLGSQGPAVEQRVFEEKNARLSNLVPVVFGDNLYAANKSWQSLPQWENFINEELPRYVNFLKNNTLDTMVEQIKKANKELIYCIKLLRVDVNLVNQVMPILNSIQTIMQGIDQQLQSAQVATKPQQYRLNLLRGAAIAVGSTARKAFNEAKQKQLEEGWEHL